LRTILIINKSQLKKTGYNMAFEKGNTQGKGRPPGSANKDNELKRAIKEGISIPDLIAMTYELEDKKDVVDRLIKLLDFAYPKMKSIEMKGEVMPLRVIIEETHETDTKTD